MSDIDVDVKNLFKKIGGVEPTYQELRRQSRTDQARSRWPLLHSLHAEAGGEAAGAESDLVFPPVPPGQKAVVSEIRPAKKSGIAKLFRALEAERVAEEAVVLQLSPKTAEKQAFSGLFAKETRREAEPPAAGFFQKRAGEAKQEATASGISGKHAESPEPASGLFNRLFEPKAPPANFWQSMFDRLGKS